MITQDLFEPDPPAYAPRSAWKEVDQNIFLSWSHRHQLAYCMARDLDTAAHAEEQSDKDFFTNRANDYKEMIACLEAPRSHTASPDKP